MEQETKQKPWTGIAAGVLVLCLILSLALSDGGARAASAGAVLELPRSGGGAQPVSGAQVGDKVVPLGRAVGIKLFAQGVLVVGLSDITTDQGLASPARACGLQEGDVITHINDAQVSSIEEVQTILQDLEGQEMELTVLRDEESQEVTTRAAPTAPTSWALGFGTPWPASAP